MTLYLTSRYENAELNIYDANESNPINFLSLVEGEIRIENTDPSLTGLWKQQMTIRLENKIASPVWQQLSALSIDVSNTYNFLRRNRSPYIRAGNRVRLLYPKTNGTKVCVFEGRIYRFISQGARFVEFICGCALTFLDTEKPADNYAQSDFDGTLTIREALDNIVIAAGWSSGVNYSQVGGDLQEPVVIEIQKDEDEPIITHAGNFLLQYSSTSQDIFYYLWHNPRTNNIEAMKFNFDDSVAYTRDDKINMNSEDVAQLDIAKSRTVVISTFDSLKPLDGAEYCVSTQAADDFGVTTVRVCYYYPTPYRKVKVTTTTTPIKKLVDQPTLDLWLPTDVSFGDAIKTVTETEYYGCDGYLWKKIKTTASDYYWCDASWYFNFHIYYNGVPSRLMNSTIMEEEVTIYTYGEVAGEVDYIYTILKQNPSMFSPALGVTPVPRPSLSLMTVREDFTDVRKKNNGYEIMTYGIDWEYDTIIDNPRRVVQVDQPTFQQEPVMGPMMEKIVFIDGVPHTTDISGNQLGCKAIGTNPDVNPYLPTEEEITIEFANTQEKVCAFAARTQRLSEGREFMLGVELDASDELLDNWKPCEKYRLTHLFLTDDYFALPSYGFYLSRTKAAFLGEFLKFVPRVATEPLSFDPPEPPENGEECPYPPPTP